jgi:uncharacterized lipoprotein YmbA
MMRNFVVWMLGLGLAILLSACSRSPRVTFYTLESGAKVESASKANSNQVVTIGPVTLPDLVDRPQLVLRVSANRVEILEVHRWAEPLKFEIPRIMADNLGNLLGSGKVSSYLQHTASEADCRVILDITRFEAFPGEAVNIEALWSLRRVGDKSPITGHFKLREPLKADGYDFVVAAYGRVLYALSQDLAKALSAEVAVNH